ncbi:MULTISPECIES: YciI family protein [Nocardia]|uniref:YciI family protein n=1 Tax=Nocardia TaxID=1817 RepID=UPI0007EB7DA1|nr:MULTISPECIES: YciI family protein [Nocardia]MBF6276727.1 hypothetical protein [Nocardia nova]OBA45121.1 hypothetical protein A5789_07345 [Nocardia sp. 852002-51101_SCH5132738]OBB47506.1 hypothetical protein A5748_22675 [Nocardia sp. 852002-51244_SCH5132740]OBF86982.1 hypothetical protein A9X06_11165 [Mycobacterium sp. 852002-51759_SCH5129042]
MSQYLILIYQDERAAAEPESGSAMAESHRQFGEDHAAALRGGNALHHSDTATSVRPDGAGDFVITDGPFAETKEQLGGYYLVDAEDLDAAIAIARRVPMEFGGVEVRPILELS